MILLSFIFYLTCHLRSFIFPTLLLFYKLILPFSRKYIFSDFLIENDSNNYKKHVSMIRFVANCGLFAELFGTELSVYFWCLIVEVPKSCCSRCHDISYHLFTFCIPHPILGVSGFEQKSNFIRRLFRMSRTAIVSDFLLNLNMAKI